jgi:hypothetical protein
MMLPQTAAPRHTRTHVPRQEAADFCKGKAWSQEPLPRGRRGGRSDLATDVGGTPCAAAWAHRRAGAAALSSTRSHFKRVFWIAHASFKSEWRAPRRASTCFRSRCAGSRTHTQRMRADRVDRILVLERAERELQTRGGRAARRMGQGQPRRSTGRRGRPQRCVRRPAWGWNLPHGSLRAHSRRTGRLRRPRWTAARAVARAMTAMHAGNLSCRPTFPHLPLWRRCWPTCVTTLICLRGAPAKRTLCACWRTPHRMETRHTARQAMFRVAHEAVGAQRLRPPKKAAATAACSARLMQGFPIC